MCLKENYSGSPSNEQARREGGGQKGSLSGGLGTEGARGSELSGLECKIHQLKLRPADAMMFFLISGRNLNICGG